MDEQEQNFEQNATHEAALWLGESISPYGLADEDATLRQADSAKWRTLFGSRKQKRFVAVKREASVPPSLNRVQQPVRDPNLSKRSSTVVPAKTLSSVISAQTFVAAVIVVGILYVSKSHSVSATDVKTFLQHAYQVDYSKMVIPAVQKIIQQIHISSTGSFTSLLTQDKFNGLHHWME